LNQTVKDENAQLGATIVALLSKSFHRPSAAPGAAGNQKPGAKPGQFSGKASDVFPISNSDFNIARFYRFCTPPFGLFIPFILQSLRKSLTAAWY